MLSFELVQIDDLTDSDGVLGMREIAPFAVLPAPAGWEIPCNDA
jgi:hypothetical protein